MKLFQRQLEEDRKLARATRQRFSVLAKESVGVPWKTKGAQFDDLEGAFAMVRSLRAERIAIHVDRDGKGLLYWSSDSPHVLNSILLRHSEKKH
jgi:hypothetical protein